jgi:Ala-tRNA(Pro) deacylase
MTGSVKELWAVQKARCSRSEILRTDALTFTGGHGFQNEKVELIIDEFLFEEETFQFHPLVNTATLVISRRDLMRFLAYSGHDVNTLVVPEQK